MRISFLKSKIRSLRKYDLVKAIIDILLPDLVGLGDFDPDMLYRKGDRVYYYDDNVGRSKILEATEDIQPGELDLSKWTVVGGASLPNAEVLKKIEIDSNNNLKYEGAVLNNVHVSKDEPQMNEKDIWFELGTSDGGEVPSRQTEVIIKNMVVQDNQPTDNNYLWGDIEEEADIEQRDDTK